MSTSIGIENASEFLSISAATITPETVSPLPQCTQQRKKLSCAKKKKKIQILTDKPVKEAIVVKKCLPKKKEKEVESKKCKKKIIQFSRSTSEDDSDVAICFDESDISFSEDFDANDYNTKELQTSDFLLCNFFTEKWRIALYVGIITSVGVEYEVKFLQKSY